MDWVWVIAGLSLLVLGGEALVRGASGIALLARIEPAVVGLTIVAAGTSAPELVVSLIASLRGNAGIAVGNIVGSNIFNVAAILGLAAAIRPLLVRGDSVRLEWPVMMLAAIALALFARDGAVQRIEGAFLVAGQVAFTALVVWFGRRAISDLERSEHSSIATASFGRSGTQAWLANGSAIAVGIGTLALGSSWLVRGAVGLASAFGVSDAMIGLTIVAAGTSTPELVTSLLASRRGQDDIAIGNVIGSNIFNVLGIGGICACVSPLEVPFEVRARDVWWMLAMSLALLPVMRTGMRIGRLEGTGLILAFVAYTFWLILGARAAAN